MVVRAWCLGCQAQLGTSSHKFSALSQEHLPSPDWQEFPPLLASVWMNQLQPSHQVITKVHNGVRVEAIPCSDLSDLGKGIGVVDLSQLMQQRQLIIDSPLATADFQSMILGDSPWFGYASIIQKWRRNSRCLGRKYAPVLE